MQSPQSGEKLELWLKGNEAGSSFSRIQKSMRITVVAILGIIIPPHQGDKVLLQDIINTEQKKDTFTPVIQEYFPPCDPGFCNSDVGTVSKGDPENPNRI